MDYLNVHKMLYGKKNYDDFRPDAVKRPLDRLVICEHTGLDIHPEGYICKRCGTVIKRL